MEEHARLLDQNQGRNIRYGTRTSAIQGNHRRSRTDGGAGLLSSNLGSFRLLSAASPGSNNVGNVPVPQRVIGLPKSYSISADGTPSYLTPIELGRQELYSQVPFTAVFGLQRRQRSVSQAFASYAAELDMVSHAEEFPPGLTETQKQQIAQDETKLIMDELEEIDSKIGLTTPLVFAIAVATASQFLVGYNTGVMNAPERVIFPGHSTALWAVAVAAFAVGGPFGAIVGGRLADSRGRRGALLVDIWTFLLGGIIQTMAQDMFSIIVARFIIGFASGFSSVLVPIYLGELAPPTLRGMLGTLTQFAMVIGIFVADVLAFPFATESKWRVLFGVTALVSTLQLLCSPFLLESPRWLLNRDPKSSRAVFIIKRLRGLQHDHEVEREIGNYIIGEAAQHQDETSQSAILMEMISHRRIRILLISSLFLQVCQQFGGINAVFYYSTSFFEGVIENPLVGTCIVGGVNVVATYVALLLMDSCGRKTLILWSSGGMFCSSVVIVLSLVGYFSNILALIAVNFYVSFFEIGLGPIPWLIVAEMFEGKYVATAMSLCSQLNWACNFVIGLVFPYMHQYLGPFSFVPFATILAMAFFYALLVLPETQGTTPEELKAEMVSRNSNSMVYEPDVKQPTGQETSEWSKAMDILRKEEQVQMEQGNFGMYHCYFCL